MTNTMTTISSRTGRHRTYSIWSLAIVACALVSAGCSSTAATDEAHVDTYDTYFASFSSDYNPAGTLQELADRSTVAAEATLVDVEDGRFFGASEKEPEGVHLNLIFETGDKTRYYVQLPRPMNSEVDQLRKVLPIGARSVVYLAPNTDPIEDGWFNVREDGNEWFFTTPQGWILEHPERGIQHPLEHEIVESFFDETADTSVETVRPNLEDWLLAEKKNR